MKKVDVLKIIESQGYKIIMKEHRVDNQWVLVRPDPRKDDMPYEFDAIVKLEFNFYGYLVISLVSMDDEKFIWDRFEPAHSSIGRSRKVLPDEVMKLKLQGFTQEAAAQKLNVSLSTIRRNWTKNEINF